MRKAALFLIAWLAVTAAGAERFPLGEIVDPVPTVDDSGETFALYLPSRYSPEKRWPIVFVLDPRSRGRAAAELFRDGAERFGYIVVSSNSTRSDNPPGDDPNPRAMVALLRDAMTRFAADERRVYLAGFSGTARYAWSVGYGLRGKVAGVIGCGGALPGPLREWRDVEFDFFGAAGETDFNWREMRSLDDQLDATAVTHRFEFFPGGHRWAPPEILTEALAWMEIRAMKSGSRAPSSELLDELYAAGAAAAHRLEETGALYAAFRRWQQLAADFEGLRDVSAARQSAARLAELPAISRDDAALRSAASREEAYRRKMLGVMAELEQRSSVTSARRIAARLEVSRLSKQAEGDSIEARSAQRRLEMAFVHTVFYTPRRLLRNGSTQLAIVSWKVAAEIKPRSWRPWYSLASAYATSGSEVKAVEHLRRAVELGFSNLEALVRDHDFDSIRSEDGYQRIVEGLKTRPD